MKLTSLFCAGTRSVIIFNLKDSSPLRFDNSPTQCCRVIIEQINLTQLPEAHTFNCNCAKCNKREQMALLSLLASLSLSLFLIIMWKIERITTWEEIADNLIKIIAKGGSWDEVFLFFPRRKFNRFIQSCCCRAAKSRGHRKDHYWRLYRLITVLINNFIDQFLLNLSSLFLGDFYYLLAHKNNPCWCWSSTEGSLFLFIHLQFINRIIFMQNVAEKINNFSRNLIELFIIYIKHHKKFSFCNSQKNNVCDKCMCGQYNSQLIN